MDIKKFQSEATKTSYNSNNAWGFGGSIGSDFTIGKLSMRKGKFCYRHAPSESFQKFYSEDIEISKDEFIKLINEL